MTQKVVFRTSGAGGFIKGSFQGKSLATLTTSSRKSSGVITSSGMEKRFNLEVGSYPMLFSLIPVSGGGIRLEIFNNGHRIFDERSGSRTGKHIDQDLVIEALIEETLPEPIIEITEPETFVFYNLFRMITKDGGKTFEKVLTSSGKISESDLAILQQNPDNIIEIVTESEVLTVGEKPIDTPESLFVRDKEGNKVYRLEFVESIIIRDDFN